MVIGPDMTRAMQAGEEDEVDALLRAAFPGPGEADLVRALRRDGAMIGEFVQPWAGRIGAYAAVSRMVEPAGWGCLAPVAVWPEWQRGRLAPRPELRRQFAFGTRLVRAIVDHLRGGVPRMPSHLVVLGDPGFYGRCGFSLERAARLETPYPVDHTLLAGPGEDVPAVKLVYPAAFDSL